MRSQDIVAVEDFEQVFRPGFEHRQSVGVHHQGRARAGEGAHIRPGGVIDAGGRSDDDGVEVGGGLGQRLL